MPFLNFVVTSKSHESFQADDGFPGHCNRKFVDVSYSRYENILGAFDQSTNLSKWTQQVFKTIINKSSTFLGTVNVASGTYFATYTNSSSPNPCAWGASASKIIARRSACGSPGKKAKNFKIDPVSSGIIRKSSENSRLKAFRVFLSQ